MEKGLPVIHVHEVYPAHKWKRDRFGEIDIFYLDVGFHNGPGCVRCGYSFCEHCNPDGWEDTNCVVDYYKCPTCESTVFWDYKFCKDCGQKLDWGNEDE